MQRSYGCLLVTCCWLLAADDWLQDDFIKVLCAPRVRGDELPPWELLPVGWDAGIGCKVDGVPHGPAHSLPLICLLAPMLDVVQAQEDNPRQLPLATVGARHLLQLARGVFIIALRSLWNLALRCG